MRCTVIRVLKIVLFGVALASCGIQSAGLRPVYLGPEYNETKDCAGPITVYIHGPAETLVGVTGPPGPDFPPVIQVNLSGFGTHDVQVMYDAIVTDLETGVSVRKMLKPTREPRFYTFSGVKSYAFAYEIDLGRYNATGHRITLPVIRVDGVRWSPDDVEIRSIGPRVITMNDDC